ncbi:MAG TPA: RNA polymerase sigma factor [Firmicutes bacterium]|nr:RNA polymerase sigma factor [Bacillota bacterium]
MGNEKAGITNFITVEYRRLVRYAARLVDGLEDWDAEDVVQDVMVRFFSRPRSGLPITKLTAYFYRAIRNRAIDLYRTHHHEESIDAPVDDDEDLHLVDLLTDLTHDVAAAVEQNELFERLYQAIDALPAKEREIILATEFAGRKYSELARELGEPIGTLLSRKSRALSRLRAAFPELTK